jgi:hypothetical protein
VGSYISLPALGGEQIIGHTQGSPDCQSKKKEKIMKSFYMRK